jgi:hypothetical protein
MAATSPQYGAYNQTQSRPQPQGFDMAAMLAAFAQMQQAQQAGALAQQQNYFTNTDPLGATARSNSRPMGLTSGSEWSGMFGDNAASAMSPEARMASQGNSATNQWASMGQNPGVDPYVLQGLNQQVGQQRAQNPMPTPNYAGAAANASPAPFQISPDSQDMISRFNAFGSAAPRGQREVRKGIAKRKGASFGMQATGNPRPGYRF